MENSSAIQNSDQSPDLHSARVGLVLRLAVILDLDLHGGSQLPDTAQRLRFRLRNERGRGCHDWCDFMRTSSGLYHMDFFKINEG